MSEVQLILNEGQPQYAVLPYDLYLQLVDDAEMLEDVRLYDEAKQAIDADEERVPAELVYAILDGDNPVKLWREYRDLSLKELADKVGISTAYLSQIETGKRTGSAETLRAIANAMHISLDDIVD
jgi:DNA-binding XRE family transcriptional regulator